MVAYLIENIQMGTWIKPNGDLTKDAYEAKQFSTLDEAEYDMVRKFHVGSRLGYEVTEHMFI
jgi:hypothetical protein